MPLWLKLCQHFDFTPFFSVVMSMAVKIYSMSLEERSPSAGISAAVGHPEGAGEEMQTFPWAPGLFWGTETPNQVGYFQRSFNRTSFTCGARKLNADPWSGGACTKLAWPGWHGWALVSGVLGGNGIPLRAPGAQILEEELQQGTGSSRA